MSIRVLAAVETVDSSDRPQSLKEVHERYQVHLKATLPDSQAQQAIRSTQTALLRYTLPGWDGLVPLSERLSSIGSAAGIAFADSVSMVEFQTARAVLDTVLQKL